MPRPAPVLFLVPQGLSVTGVNTWALSVCRRLTAAGRHARLLVHGRARGHDSLPLPPGAPISSRDDLPDLTSPGAPLETVIRAYHDEADALAREAGRPAVLIPTRLGGCFAAAAALCISHPQCARLLAWQQVESAYEDALIGHVEPASSALVGASTRLTQRLRDRFPHRAADIHSIPNAVEVPAEPTHRPQLAGRPCRLIYTGRLDHTQKRVLALAALSRELTRRGIEHTLEVLGDGPAAEDLARDAPPAVTLRGLAGPDAVRAALRRADLFVLPSRSEGLSFSLLEAMSTGCVPVIARTSSGADEAVEDGVSGAIAGVDADADARATGAALADAVARTIAGGVARAGRLARTRVQECYSLSAHTQRLGDLADAAAEAPARCWPAGRPIVFSGSAPGCGAIPPDAGERMDAVLASLCGRRVVIHGTGAHTHGLAAVVTRPGSPVVAMADDDHTRWDTEVWGRPVINPRRAGEFGATDVVISSWIHEDVIWNRRDVYTTQGIAVHRLYDARTSVPAI